MNKNNLYIIIGVLGGFLIGYLIFGNATDENSGEIHDHDQEMATEQMWTCSMDPQVMQSEPGKCPICGMDLIPVASGDDGLAMGQFKMTKNAMALADIRTTKVDASGLGSNNVNLSGKITINEKAMATQAAYFDGRIENLFVNSEGESVQNGQLLATIYAPELVSAQQELLTTATLKKVQPGLYQAVRNKLKLWKLSENQIQQIEASGKVMENFQIYANVTGTVSKIMVDAGDYVTKGSPLFKITNLATVWAVFDTYEHQAGLLREGQLIEIVPKSYPDKKFDAEISFINPLLNTDTRTIEVRAVLQNPKGLLKPGMFVAGSLTLNSDKKAGLLVIPESAVLWTGKRSVVYIKTDPDNPTFEMREVTLGDATDQGYIILSGLENGDEIVTNGTFTVDAAAQLKGKKSMMNTEGGKIKTGHEGHEGMK